MAIHSHAGSPPLNSLILDTLWPAPQEPRLASQATDRNKASDRDCDHAPALHLHQLPDVLTVREAAAVLRIGRNSAYELARQGTIPTIRLGRRLMVPKLALLRMLDNTSTGLKQ